MNNKDSYFMHMNNSPALAPFGECLIELGIRRHMSIASKYHPVHVHDGIEFHYVIKGSYQWKIGEQVFHVYPGDMLINSPWQGHGSATQMVQKGSFGWLSLRPRSFSRGGDLNLGSWSCLGRGTQQEIGRLLVGNINPIPAPDSKMIPILQEIHKELIHPELGCREKIGLLLDYLLLDAARMVAEKQSPKNDDDDFLQKVNACMNECLVRRINMDEMAYSFGVSVTTFNNKLKKLTGFSPADYLICLKVEKVRNMLVKTRSKITDIAIECGFSSSQHLAKQFLKRTGMTPTNYRNRGGMS